MNDRVATKSNKGSVVSYKRVLTSSCSDFSHRRYIPLSEMWPAHPQNPSCTLQRSEIPLKQRSYGLSFHELRPRFALFPIVGTGRIDVARGLVSASVDSRIMAVNSSHIKGRVVARRRQCIRSHERCQEICQATRHVNSATVRNSTAHSPQVRTSSH
ncbi:hypothetical protein AVEN_85606-1 [Araneus ventricosus]|uniref:Uncharacterized protein n=1 Tax=Araneus ventricosus TaxID=182803 RepID=A0A4Y2W654_ARAVE|nr:hypothetical protein AVEN_213300-1 [Araneus ventricosus]GBO33217.1 hypothetical protein AVEN_85606-1 [Araneus ventricosus]